MGCASSLPVTDNRTDVVQWYDDGGTHRRSLIHQGPEPCTAVNMNGFYGGAHKHLLELQYLTRALDLKRLTYVSDYQLTVDDKEAKVAYTEFAQHAHHLEYLSLEKLQAGPECLFALFQNLPSPGLLRELVLDEVLVDDTSVRAIVSKRFENLTSLTIKDPMFMAGSWKSLLESLPALTALDVPETNIGSAGLGAVLSHRKLETLVLRECPMVQPQDLAAIAEQAPALVTLDVGGCPVTAAFFQSMVAHAMPNLRTLDLGTTAKADTSSETLEAFHGMVAAYRAQGLRVVASDGPFAA